MSDLNSLVVNHTKAYAFDPAQTRFTIPGDWKNKDTYFQNHRNLIGIEVEVENNGKWQWPTGMLFWQVESDNSLKQNGAEFISTPVGGRNIDYALFELQDVLPEARLWSHRTSIHVHSDVRHLRLWQLRALISYYAVFENAFFSIVAEHRQGNSFCYPITDLPPGVTPFNGQELKYCAFNPGSSMYHGTVEWRHMDGNDDFRRIRRWIQLICKLQKWVESKGRTDLKDTINIVCNNGSYEQLAREIFGPTIIAFGDFDFKTECDKTIKWAILNMEKEI